MNKNNNINRKNTSDPNPLNNDENKPPTGDENNLAQENIKDDLKTEIPEEPETPEPSETSPKETEISEEVREEGEESLSQEEEPPEAEETFSEETLSQEEETPEAEETFSEESTFQEEEPPEAEETFSEETSFQGEETPEAEETFSEESSFQEEETPEAEEAFSEETSFQEEETSEAEETFSEETSFQEEETPEAEEAFSEETSSQEEETPEAEELSSQDPPSSERPPSPGLSTTAPTGMGTAAGMGGSKVLYIIIGILSMILVAGGLYVAVNWGSIQKGEPLRPDLDESTQDWTGEKPKEAGKQEGIAIPGFAEMRLKAGQSAQEVSLYNPEQNTSYFVITLTVDGTEIFKSKMIPPGKALYEIELTNTLAPGTYAGVVNYQCFAMDDALSPQNGANMKCSVVVE